MSKIMSVNAGSSSLKFQLLEMTKSKEEVITEGQFEKIGLPDPNFKIKFNGKKEEYDAAQEAEYVHWFFAKIAQEPESHQVKITIYKAVPTHEL